MNIINRRKVVIYYNINLKRENSQCSQTPMQIIIDITRIHDGSCPLNGDAHCTTSNANKFSMVGYMHFPLQKLMGASKILIFFFRKPLRDQNECNRMAQTGFFFSKKTTQELKN